MSLKAHLTGRRSPFSSHADALTEPRSQVAFNNGGPVVEFQQITWSSCLRAYRKVLRAAETKAADLIVIGAQGRGRIGLAPCGSTTQQRGAMCPVLTVRGLPPLEPRAV